eukprot:TRINITY_DN110943_c0_g1_i1.p1 TRINITY_DN110943_c0_g1~~TRINITY_DN110943_c0_g1_i1.p1  ORF type:complete len:294 (+),score=60.65 TRINITY_DN110943_c0_g1_i1:46-927(+)
MAAARRDADCQVHRGYRPARRPLVIAVLSVSAALHAAALSCAWVEPARALLAGRCLGRSSRRRSLVGLRASYDRKKMMKEASFTEGLMRDFSKMFAPKAPEISPEDQEEEARREASCERVEEALKPLKLSVLAGEDSEGEPQRRAAPIRVLQSQAKQSLALFVVPQGRESLITDVLLSMRLEAKDLSERNLLVVLAIVDVEGKSVVEFPTQIRNSKLMRQPSIALPFGASEQESAAWGELLAAEFQEADEQGFGDKARETGLALVVTRDGEVARRGVGRPNWKVVFQDTDEPA